jgi:hypothetical protein
MGKRNGTAARWLGQARAVSWRGAGSASVGAPSVVAWGRNARGAPGGASAWRLMRAHAARPGVGLLARGEDLGASGKGRSRGLGGLAAKCARGRLLARRSDREREAEERE